VKVDDHRLEFLNSLERAEARLLSWGLVDGSFSANEIGDLCETYLEDNELWTQYSDEEDFQDALEAIGFLYDFHDGMRRRYRTRMAESLRLMSRLRQLFPKHMTSGNTPSPTSALPNTHLHSAIAPSCSFIRMGRYRSLFSPIS
jgi:hypothetical protein